MIRLLYDHEFFSAFPYSGITRYFNEVILRTAVTEGFRVSLFMGFHLNRFGIEAERGKLDRFFGIHRPSIPRTTRLFNAFNDLAFPAFGALSRSDVFHQTYYAPLYRGFRGKRIVTVHDMTYELYPALFPSTEAASRMKREAVERADGIIAVSESSRRDLMRILGVPGERIRTIHHGNSLLLDRGPRPEVEGEYVLYVGQRIAHKNFSALLRAFARAPGVAAGHRLVCFGGTELTADERRSIRELGLEGKVLRLSGPDRLLANLYGYARALIYPSLYEGFGLPLLEAMGFGCPIAASGTSSLPEVAGEAAIYFDPQDEEAMAHAIAQVTGDSELRARLSAEGRRRARGFTWDRCAAEHMEFYREVAGA
jgi:glycosyltransferase involved in cell wall biosynthesis